MTKRKLAVLAFVGGEAGLLIAALVFQLFGYQLLSLVAVTIAIAVLALALAAIWRRLEMKNAAVNDALLHLTQGTSAGDSGASEAHTSGSEFLIGRAAGNRQPGTSSHDEQERQLFGGQTTWQRLTDGSPSESTIAVLGARDRYDAALPPRWASDVQLVPGVLVAQATAANAGIVLCDSSVFTEAPWNRAIDAAGTWLVQELERLKSWADDSGSLLVFFDHSDTPIGVNTATVRRYFHLVITDGEPQNVEGAPAPKAMRELHELYGLLAAHRNGARTL